MRKQYFNQAVKYIGTTDSNYTNGELNSIDITPMTKGDSRWMVYKTVTNIFKEGSDPSGYKVYSSIEDIQKDFEWNVN